MRLSDRLMRDAESIVRPESVLQVEQWASGWLGQNWLTAGVGERDPDHALCLEVVGRASTRPSPRGLAAVAALRRIVAPKELPMLDESVAILSESQPSLSWAAAEPFEPVKASRAVDVWDSEHLLAIEFADPVPHTLMAQTRLVGGVLVEKLALLSTEAAEVWDELRDNDAVPMPIVECSVPDALAELADALRTTDMTLPRQDDEDFVDLRALAWSRCRPYLPAWPDPQRMAEEERARLLDDFVAETAVPDDGSVVRSLAEMFLDYGENYMPSGPLCWSPDWVGLFLTDWLPRKAVLDAAHRTALPELLKHWIRFALGRRAVAPEWVVPVVDAVGIYLSGFAASFDDVSAWGPAKQIAAQLAVRGVDLTDPAAVDEAISALNAENLARRLIGE